MIQEPFPGWARLPPRRERDRAADDSSGAGNLPDAFFDACFSAGAGLALRRRLALRAAAVSASILRLREDEGALRDAEHLGAQFVNAHLVLETIQNGVTIPSVAIKAGPSGPFAYVGARALDMHETGLKTLAAPALRSRFRSEGMQLREDGVLKLGASIGKAKDEVGSGTNSGGRREADRTGRQPAIDHSRSRLKRSKGSSLHDPCNPQLFPTPPKRGIFSPPNVNL